MKPFVLNTEPPQKTNITIQEMQAMSDGDLKVFLRRYAYRSQFDNSDAFDHALARLALMQGSAYAATGNKSAFFTAPV